MNSRLLTGAMTVGLSLSGAHDAAADEPTTNDGFSAALKLNVLNGESTPPAPATQPPLSDAILAEMRAQLTSMFAGEVSADADPTKGVVVGKEAGACAYVDRDLRTSGAKEVPTIYKDAVRSTAAIAAGQAVCAEQNPVFAEADTKRELLNIDRVKMVTITTPDKSTCEAPVDAQRQVAFGTTGRVMCATLPLPDTSKASNKPTIQLPE